MNYVVLEWLEDITASRNLEGPVVEFGSLQVEGQEERADMRRFFPGLEYVGCDLAKGPGVDRVENVEFGRFAPGSAGTVLCLETLEHVRRPWEAVKEIFRILKPGGTALFSIPFNFPVHNHPDDYWRMTASGLQALLMAAGFEEIAAADSGEYVEWDLYWDRPGERPGGTGEPLKDERHFPFSVFAVAVKPGGGDPEGTPLTGGGVELEAPVIREINPARRFSGTVPVVMVLYHREEDTREVLSQLDRVTDDYELVLVDNGFDDAGLIRELKPASYIRNEENVGIIRAINQGLDAARGPYVAVLHSDLLIYEEGWLDHAIEFMERRPDVGLVSLAGRHCIKEDGTLDEETLVCGLPEYGEAFRPSWRFTEIAAADGIALVMRDLGFRMDESLGALHYYDIDISIQYIAAGYRVYNANVEFYHLREKYFQDGDDVFAAMTSGSAEDDSYIEARARFREKWSHLLPICRGYMEEQYAYHRVDELLDRVSTMEKYMKKVGKENVARGLEIERASEYVRRLERQLEQASDESHDRAGQLERVKEYVSGLEDQLARGTQAPPSCPGPSRLERLGFYLRTEGALPTFMRALKKLVSPGK